MGMARSDVGMAPTGVPGADWWYNASVRTCDDIFDLPRSWHSLIYALSISTRSGTTLRLVLQIPTSSSLKKYDRVSELLAYPAQLFKQTVRR
jgi:hypothetical protein